MYRIYVYGMGLKDVAEENGGWQKYAESYNKEYIEELFHYLEQGHGSNVVMLEPDETVEDIWEEVDMDDYRTSYQDYISSYIY